ncbi:Serine/threonine-protein phosphatase 6 regulatory ankyrin repeat subunit A [Metarhizium anisopliae]|nr:Serine/threonine-protein phosphatase 6 regulatory ankyrin repeat subunit A [Metarhizium anisopliae]
MNDRDNNGNTPLHNVRYGHGTDTSQAALEALINNGAGVSARNDNWQSPLHLACLSADLEAVVSLLKHGASIAELDVDGMNSLHYAAQRRNMGNNPAPASRISR